VLCHSLKCIFVHIPKTAGQSIERVFLRHVGLTWEQRAPLLLRANRDPRLGPPRLAHLTAAEYITCGHVTGETFRDYFKFSFVRNPWDRMVSEYKYRFPARNRDFKTFLFSQVSHPVWSDNYRHVMMQAEYLFDEQGQLLVDFVGRYEQLHADFVTVCQRLQLNDGELPHVNKASHQGDERRHYSEYYDSESREFVADRFRRDVTAFKYEFEHATGD
jgi:hypothetical protein